MTSNNPWNNIVTKEFANEKITAAFDDFEMLTTYISTKKYENKDKEYKLQLSFYPQHFVGDVRAAKIIILGANPGFDDNFKTLYDNNKIHQQNIKNNLQLKDGQIKFHAFDLDQEKLGYWGKKLKFWLNNPKIQKMPEESIPWFTSNLALAEFFPYHSVKYDTDLDSFFDKNGYLPSQKFLFDLLRNRIINDEDPVTIILMRSFNKWYKAIPELLNYEKCYECNNVNNPSLKPEKIFKVKRKNVKKDLDDLLIPLKEKK